MYFLDKVKLEITEKINKALGSDLVQVTDLSYPQLGEHGDISFACFILSKELSKSPADIASELVGKIGADGCISGVNALGPYLNFTLEKEYLAKEALSEVETQKDNYGRNKDLKGKRIMIEFAHPNPFKSFHIGHLRNIILGESIVRLLEAQGAEVIRTNYQGDVGMHIAKCLWSFKDVKVEDYPENADEKVALLGKCYAEGAKAFEENDVAQQMTKLINEKIYKKDDEEVDRLWETGKKWSLEKFHEIYDRVYSHFDREYMESEVMEDGVKRVNDALDKGILEKSEGAIIFNGSKHKLDTRVFMNSQGLPTYEGKEIGLAFREFSDFGDIDLCIHVVAVEQISFFKVTFKVEELLDEKLFKGKQYHHAYEFVGLKKGKMSSRKGDVVLGNDILNEAVDRIKDLVTEKGATTDVGKVSEIVGVGAIKYSFLKISPFKYLAFDMEESISFEGDSGPYIQYTNVRINSILEKAGRINKDTDLSLIKEEKESKLVMHLAKYPEIVKKSAKEYNSSEMTKYLFELAQFFNDYYHSVQILKSEKKTRDARLALCVSVSQVIKNGLDLLGIKVVDKM